MDPKILVIDNFLDYPDIVRKSALSLSYPLTGNYPGRRSRPADASYQQMIKDKLTSCLNRPVFFTDEDESFCFQICLEGSETWAHTDLTEWAGVLYLTPNAPAESGTGFYTMLDDLPILNSFVANVYNRLILYRGNIMHHASLLAGFGDSLENGRLTQVFFFNTYERADK